jgi:hypothetical protein
VQYRAPECLLTDGYYGYKMDLWGIGCVMFEVIALFPLFPGTNELDQIERIHNIVGTPPPAVLAKFKKYATHMEFNFAEKVGTGIAKLIPHAGETCIDLIQKLLAYDPENRLSARQALRHPYFSELRQADKARERAAAKEATTEGDAATQGGDKAGPGGAPAPAALGTAPSASNDSSESPDAAPQVAAPPKKKKDKQQQQDHQDRLQQQQLQQPPPPQQQQQQLRQQQQQQQQYQFRDEHEDSTTADAIGGADAASSATRSPQIKTLPNAPKAQRVNANADQPLPLPAIPKPAKDNAKAAAGAGAGAGLPSKQYDAQGYISSINNQTYSSSSVYSGSQQQQQQQKQLGRQQQQQQKQQQQGIMYDAYGNPSKQKQQQQFPPPPQQPKSQQQPPRTYDDYGASSKRGTAHSSEALATRGNKASNARTYHEYDSGNPKESPDAKAGSSLKSAKYQSPYSQRYIARQRVIT